MKGSRDSSEEPPGPSQAQDQNRKQKRTAQVISPLLKPPQRPAPKAVQAQPRPPAPAGSRGTGYGQACHQASRIGHQTSSIRAKSPLSDRLADLSTGGQPGRLGARMNGSRGPSPGVDRLADSSTAEGSGGDPSPEDLLAEAQSHKRQRTDKPAFIRPTQRERPAGFRRPPPAGPASERMDKAVLGGCLWHPECRAGDSGLPAELPTSFASVEEYVSSYEALVLEEARASLGNDWAERADRAEEGTILSMDELPGGWASMRLSIQGQHAPLVDGSLVVLCTRRLTKYQAQQFLKDGTAGNGRPGGREPAEPPLAAVAGIVRAGAGSMKANAVNVSLHPRCAQHALQQDACCSLVLEQLRRLKPWWVVRLAPLTTQRREFEALQKVQTMTLVDTLMKPEQLAELGKQIEKQHRNEPGGLPRDVFGEGVKQRLQAQFDATQMAAISAATRHLDVGPEGLSSPFVLICGPPGTGKTHTVTGILNIWHLTYYTRHQASINDSLRGDVSRNALFEDLHRALDNRLEGLAAKPRILVCAPSNAAADELLQRVMVGGFVGNDGRTYFPNVVRVGSPSATIGVQAKAVLVDDLVSNIIKMDPQEWAARMQNCNSSIQQLSRNIMALQVQLAENSVPEEAGTARDIAMGIEMEAVRQLVEKHDARARLILDRERLSTVTDLMYSRQSFDMRTARQCLELSFVREAEMAFTTLSSTGRKVFADLPRGHFETVLIDEAAQASEIQSLQALVFGCKRVVLVGDPQQLPATILSQRAKDLLLERSLFERLQQGGCPVHTLLVQYRMHPAIRTFPSKHFYQNRLVDGDSVLREPPEVFYTHRLLQPFLFFDVVGGRDVQATNGNFSGSRRNEAEAELAASLFVELRTLLLRAAKEGKLKKPTIVGVITPYRDQVSCIESAFCHAMGKKLASEVVVNTVDAFQGRQLDVVILSCVRANQSGNAIGFVNDIRRMNVAITRAKRALWVLGSRSTLERSPVWAALLTDASQRGLIVPHASARTMFGHQAQFQPGFLSLAFQDGPSREATPPSQSAARPDPAVAAASEIPGLASETASGPQGLTPAPAQDPRGGAPMAPRMQRRKAETARPPSRGPTAEAKDGPVRPRGFEQDPRTQRSASAPPDAPADPRLQPGVWGVPPSGAAAQQVERHKTHVGNVQAGSRPAQGTTAVHTDTRGQPGAAPLDPRLQATARFVGTQGATKMQDAGAVQGTMVTMGVAAAPSQPQLAPLYASAQPGVQYKPRDFSRR